MDINRKIRETKGGGLEVIFFDAKSKACWVTA
jgi:hypothetical protein